ncbi:DNA polymerase III subunit delta [Coleofasciculus sp.]|uniref:DNA polymerase III subunit delta n=1 Tax=Coleofasciculus sp. TaxID=3100458 RepID=UPI0039F8D85C
MPIHIYFGDDEFRMERAIKQLRTQIISPPWESFNVTHYPPGLQSLPQALSDIMTPPFGNGNRLVVLPNSSMLEAMDDQMLGQLEQILPAIPESNTLVLTRTKKPDGRLKSTKLLQKYAQIQEFFLIPAWKTDPLVQQVKTAAEELGVDITSTAAKELASAVGNDTRLLYSELEKLATWSNGSSIDANQVKEVVEITTQTAIALAAAIRTEDTTQALQLLSGLRSRNEPMLKVVATLITLFRQWLWVKLLTLEGETDNQILAKYTEIANPNRVYYLCQEVSRISLPRLQRIMAQLLELDVTLKSSSNFCAVQSQIVELCFP